MAPVLVAVYFQGHVLPLCTYGSDGLLYGQLLAGSSGYVPNLLSKTIQANLNDFLKSKSITCRGFVKALLTTPFNTVYNFKGKNKLNRAAITGEKQLAN